VNISGLLSRSLERGGISVISKNNVLLYLRVLLLEALFDYMQELDSISVSISEINSKQSEI